MQSFFLKFLFFSLSSSLLYASNLPRENHDFLRLNWIKQESSLNSYALNIPLLDQMIHYGMRSIEFDLHTSKPNHPDAIGDWYVYHIPYLDEKSLCLKLSDCLNILKIFHDQFPKHEVITVFMDIKNAFEDGHKPENLDMRIKQFLKSNLYSPKDLIKKCPRNRFQDTVNKCGWPSLEALKGKFIFVLTDSTQNLKEYTEYGKALYERVAFIAPTITSKEEIYQNEDAVFFNLNASHSHLLPKIHQAGFISRVFNSSTLLRSHHTALTHLSESQVASYPFSCMYPELHSICERKTECVNAKKVHAIALPSSGERFCIMDIPIKEYRLPYVAICRNPGNSMPYMIWQTKDDEEEQSFTPDQESEHDSLLGTPFIRLEKTNSSCYRGLASSDNKNWEQLGEEICVN